MVKPKVNKNNDADLKESFDMIPNVLRSKCDLKYIGLLSMIVGLTVSSGYCKASDNYFINHTAQMTPKKIRSWLDWLEANGFIVRYNQLNKVNGDFLRTKRIIVLSAVSYDAYKPINKKIHEPINCPDGFLPHAEFLERTKRKQPTKKKPANNSKSSNQADKHDDEYLTASNASEADYTNMDSKTLLGAKNDRKESNGFKVIGNVNATGNYNDNQADANSSPSSSITQGVKQALDQFDAKNKTVVTSKKLTAIKNSLFIKLTSEHKNIGVKEANKCIDDYIKNNNIVVSD